MQRDPLSRIRQREAMEAWSNVNTATVKAGSAERLGRAHEQ